jgi:oxygen-independent coproporphyrinogen-3 oxidase
LSSAPPDICSSPPTNALRMDLIPDFSLYLHIPFCRHRCAYCDFNTYSTIGKLMPEYMAALGQEIKQVGGGIRRSIKTIYFGGGTPSLVSPRQLDSILEAVSQTFELSIDAEITLEANPESIDGPYLKAINKIGINRISIGAQSANPVELALLEREHDFEAVARAVNLSRAAGINNLNLDLIYGLPDQSLGSWVTSLRAALQLSPDHLSLYCLTIEPGTPMFRWLNKGQIPAPDPDRAADQYEIACSLLDEKGYDHYEISNWSKPGRACEHNLTYWRNDEYLGLGAGAHGHADGYRYAVVRQPRVYIRRMLSDTVYQFPWSAAVASTRHLSPNEAMSDTIITQLRLLHEGLDMSAFTMKFGQTLFDAYPGVIEKLFDWRLVRQENQHLLLTERGRFLSNQVFVHFM